MTLFHRLAYAAAMLLAAVSVATSLAVPPQAPAPPQAPPTLREVEPGLEDVQVPIRKAHRLPNRTGSQCVWVTLESLGLHNGLERLKGVSRTRPGVASQGDVNAACRGLGVTVVSTGMGGMNTAFLQEYVARRKLGAGVGVGHGPVCHVITMVHFEKGVKVKVIDNAGPSALEVQTWDWESFRSRHNGWAFAVVP